MREQKAASRWLGLPQSDRRLTDVHGEVVRPILVQLRSLASYGLRSIHRNTPLYGSSGSMPVPGGTCFLK